jgi:general secretion pathway protein L
MSAAFMALKSALENRFRYGNSTRQRIFAKAYGVFLLGSSDLSLCGSDVSPSNNAQKRFDMAGDTTSALERFWHWWAGELKDIAPTSWRAAPRRQARRLIISVEAPRKALLLERGGQIETLAQTDDADDDLSGLVRLIKARARMPVGVRLRESDCFSRTMQLPVQAEADYRRILELDMERTTPLRSAEVLSAFHIAPLEQGLPRGKRTVRHLVVKRRTVDPLLRQLRDLGIEPAFMDCWDAQRRGGLPVDFLAALKPPTPERSALRPQRLAGLAAALLISAVGISIVRHQSALAGLETRAEAARVEAGNTRLAVEASQTAAARIEAMRMRMRDRLPAARIIEELTTIMPDDAWVSDLRIEGDTVEVTGFAKSAAALVSQLESAPLFADVLLTSPVVLDSTEDKERFSLRLLLTLPGRQPAQQPGDTTTEIPEQ